MPQTADQITSNALLTLLASTNQVTNLNVGSLVRSILDALGAESARLEQEIHDQVAQAILNAAYQIWQITPLQATASVYQLQFSNTTGNPVNIAQGTQVTIPNSSLIWTTQSPITVPAGTTSNPGTATVNATCTVTGSQTNVPANTITLLVNPISGISVTNPNAQAIVPGTDAETPTQTQARLANAVATIHRGDANAIAAGLLKDAYLTDSSGNITEQVTKALAVDYSPGVAYVYAANASGSLSSQLQSFAQQVVNGYTDASGVVHIGYKAAGVQATVYPALANPVNVAVSILPAAGVQYQNITSQVQAAITAFFNALDIEQSFQLGAFIRALVAVPGVADVDVTSPTATLPGVPNVANPTTAPVLTAVSGSTGLVAGTYYVSYTFTNAWGETLASPQSSVTITAGQAIQVGAISLPFGATGVNYYLSTAAGLTTVAYDAAGTGAQINLTALPASGANNPPSSNTALIHGNLYTQGTVTLTQMGG